MDKKHIGIFIILLLAMMTQSQPVSVEPMTQQSPTTPPVNAAGNQDANQIAQYTMARRYMTGEDGVEKNPALGKLLLEKAALAGNVYAQAELTNLEAEAQEARRATNTQKIVNYYTDLANKGIDTGLYEMGRRYVTGTDGVEKNLALGRSMLERAASVGNIPAQAELANLDVQLTEGRQINEPAGVQTATDQLEQQIKALEERIKTLEEKVNQTP